MAPDGLARSSLPMPPSPCATSSMTWPRGGGRKRLSAGWCSPPTSPASPRCCPGSELLDLELDCLMDYGPNGTWLRVPLGKLNDERAVPLDDVALAAFDEWLSGRSPQRSLPHPRDGRLCDFVFVERGRRIGPGRIQHALSQAVTDAGLLGTDGQQLRVVAHQLRHTWATELVNAGMSLQALMALLGHRSPEMTIRYARLASPTLRAAYDQAV